MAADLVEDPTIDHTFVHDLESAFYVVFWLSIRLLPNSLDPGERAHIIREVFNSPPISGKASDRKRSWVAAGPNRQNQFKVHQNRPLTGLIDSLHRVFQVRYSNESRQGPSDILNFAPSGCSLLTVDKTIMQEHLDCLGNHKGIISLFEKSLTCEIPWPEEDPATKQDISFPSELSVSASRSKRSTPCHGKDTASLSTKRHRGE